MKFKGFGFLLFTEKFDECVHFYKKIMQLPVLFNDKDILTNFKLSDSCYLMVENFGTQAVKQKELYRNPTVIRFDTERSKLNNWISHLKANKIELEVCDYDWGHTISFYDPDGNRCEIYAPLENMLDNFTAR